MYLIGEVSGVSRADLPKTTNNAPLEATGSSQYTGYDEENHFLHCIKITLATAIMAAASHVYHHKVHVEDVKLLYIIAHAVFM